MKNSWLTPLNRLHAKIGDFWWYSLMIFCAARAADCLNVFVGLWLVPKYVPPAELGAVQPLTSFASLLAIPAGVFASTFRQELSNLAVRRDFGKMKTLMRGVFIATAVFFFAALVVAKIVLPSFLWRIRVAEGSLGLVILAASFSGPVASVYSTPLQALKKFRATSAIHVLCAPIRLAVMLVAMPYRALVGYFVGQASTPTFSVVASVLALRKELSVRAEPYWNSGVVRRFGKLFFLFGASSFAGALASLAESTIIRQRLPEADSAAFYIITRFSDIGSYLANTLTFTIFPFAAELAARGRSTNSLVVKASAAIALTNALLAAFFWMFGRQIIAFIPHGDVYAEFFWAIPFMLLVNTINAASGLYTTAEASANRFGYVWYTIPIAIAYAAAIVCVTGWGYFKPHMPQAVNDFVASINIRSLSTMLVWMTAVAVVRLAFCGAHARRVRKDYGIIPAND